MHARAACRLETLGFDPVYRYAPGNADWRAMGWPTEGQNANTLRAHHAVTRDVPTCAVDEPVSVAAQRATRAGVGACIVVDPARIVLGRLRGRALIPDDHRPAEAVMENGPTTTRADDDLAAVIDRMTRRNVTELLVTDPDGKLIGILHRGEAERVLHDGTSN
jgi:CBS domain-containing protein